MEKSYERSDPTKKVGEAHKIGSVEDLTLTIEVLNKFLGEKLRQMGGGRGAAASTPTGATWSVCHVDGVTDGDGGEV